MTDDARDPASPEEAEALLRGMSGGLPTEWPHVPSTTPPLTPDRYQTLIEQIDAITFMATFDPDCKEQEIYVSPQIETMLGYTQKEWTSNPQLWYASLHPADKPRWDAEFAETVMTGDARRSVYRFRHKSGRTVWILGDVRIQRDPVTKMPKYVQGVGVDVTALKETEEALRAAQEELRQAKERELALKQLEVNYVRAGLVSNRASETLIGASPAMRALRDDIARYAASPDHVLVTGESGTGKELVSQALHYSSPRAGKPLVILNAAALSETLIQSELFGHEKGAFTGAADRHVGAFEQANGGTLFLDEIGDMPLEIQAKILRVIEGQPFRRLGGKEPLQVDVRLVCATNKPLKKLVAEGRFREDLYYRINALQIAVPALRDRQGDVLEIAEYFLAARNREQKRRVAFSDAARHSLRTYPWPGNIRELRNVIGRAFVRAAADLILPDDLSPEVAGEKPQAPSADLAKGMNFYERVEEIERALIVQALQGAQGVKARAARVLALSINTLTDKMTQYGITTLKDAPWVKVS